MNWNLVYEWCPEIHILKRHPKYIRVEKPYLRMSADKKSMNIMQNSALSFHWWRQQGQRWEELPQVPVGGPEEVEFRYWTPSTELSLQPQSAWACLVWLQGLLRVELLNHWNPRSAQGIYSPAQVLVGQLGAAHTSPRWPRLIKAELGPAFI